MTAVRDANARCFNVALTGGIASGKSTVQRLFEDLGVTVFDADVISRELVARGQPALDEIVGVFGPNALDAQGELDRRRMREIVFADATAKRKLEDILHPRVRTELCAKASACSADYCLLAIPLLVESGSAYRWVDHKLVVDVPPRIQLDRLMTRDGMTADFAERALAMQASREDRLAIADDVVDNAGTPADLPAFVARLHARYLRFAQQRQS